MQVRLSPRSGSARGVAAGVVLGLALVMQACAPSSASSPSGSSVSASRSSTSSALNGRFFGMHAPGLASAFPRAKVGAVNLTTNAVYWPALETAPGQWDFSRLDALVATAQKNGAKPLLVLGQTPKFHSTTPTAANVAASVPDMAAWRTYVSTVAARYQARVDYEIWPEPDIIQNWTGTKPQLAALVAAASNIIHQKSRAAVVVAPAMVLRLKGQQRFMDAFYGVRVGGKPVGRYVDAVGIDPYPTAKGTPEDSLALIKKARTILHRHKVTAPVWNVEINYGVVGAGATTSHHLSTRKQSSYVVRTYLLNAASGMKRVYWLGWSRYSTMAIQMVGADGTTPTAAGKAYSRVRGWMLNQRVQSCTRNAKTHVWTCKLVRAGKASWVYWVPSGKAHVRAPKGSRHVETMTGARSRTHAGKRLTVTDAPIRVYH